MKTLSAGRERPGAERADRRSTAVPVPDERLQRDAVATIEISVGTVTDLFDTLDPAPLPTRTLEGGAERYLVARARAHRSTAPPRLVVHLPESLRPLTADATVAIHEHFRRAHAHGEWAFRRRLRVGGVTLAVALGVLAGSFWLRGLLSGIEGQTLAQGLGEGLLILGWVAMWRPVEILLFEHWESHLDHATLERLASVPIAFVFRPDAAQPAQPDL